MLIDQIDYSKEKKIRISPCNSNRASELGHECTRYLVYNRTIWDQKIPHDVGLQYVFDMGNEIEAIVLKELSEAGFALENQQRDFQDAQHKITGHIDSMIIIDGKKHLLEVKSSSPYIFDTITDLDSVKNHKFPYIRKYYAQVNLYLYLSGVSDEGILLFKNKTSGKYKEILIPLDYELCENLLKKAEEIEGHLKNNTLPDRIQYDDQICGKCPFVHICCPSPKSEGVQFIVDNELEELLQEYDTLQSSVKKFKEIDEQLKLRLKEQDKICIGDFYITGGWRQSTKYNIPNDIKATYKETSQYWVKKITKIQEVQ